MALAAEPDTLQLTDAVLANLTAYRLSNIDLFRFEDSDASSAKAKRSTAVGECKVYLGD